MSKQNFNLDLRVPLEEIPEDDLRYALDRNLVDETEQRRISNFLSGSQDEEDEGEDEDSILSVLSGSVREVMDEINSREDLTQDQVDSLIEAENNSKVPRKGVLEFLEAIDFEDEDADEEDEGEE